MFKAILVDDEVHALKTLRWELEQHCPEVEVLASYSRAEEALAGIPEYAPDLLLLDIEMPRMSGFDLIARLPPIQANIIFISAYDKYAIQAFRVNAINYFLKPFDGQELRPTLDRLRQARDERDPLPDWSERMASLKAKLTRIAIPQLEGLTMLRPDEILYGMSEGAYTKIVLADRSLLMSRHIKVLEQLLAGQPFFRIHKSYLINLDHLQGFYKSEGGYVQMSNGTQLPVARRKKAELLALFSAE